MSYGYNYPALFRAHNTALQTNIFPTGPFFLQFSEGCEIIGVYYRLNVQNNAYVYGDVKVTAAANNQSYDIGLTPTAMISSMISEGWQVASDISLTVMVGDDAIYNVADDNVGMILLNNSSGITGASSADQTRVFGIRMEATP
jgi:hypothetical protein